MTVPGHVPARAPGHATGEGGDDFASLFEFLPIGAYRSRPDGQMMRANPALVRLNGFDTEADHLASLDEIAGCWYADPGRQAAFRHLLERDGRVIGFESEVHRRRTNERIWIREHAYMVRAADGTPRYYEGTVEEITERIDAQQALARSADELRQLTARVPGALYRLTLRPDGQRRIDFMSDGIEALLGIAPDAARQQFGLIGSMRHPDDRERVDRELEASNREGRPLLVEYRVRLHDGREKWIEQASTPTQSGPDGTWVRYGVMLDITERKRAQALQAERDRAEAADRAKTLFLSRVSHELRTPLNAILGFAQLLQMQGSFAEGSREAVWLTQVLGSGRHLLALMDDVLDLSSAQTGHLPVHLMAVDLAPLVGEVLGMAQPVADEAGITLNAALPDVPLRVRADVKRLKQVLGNLLSNAVKYNRRGGQVRVEARTLPDNAAPPVAGDPGTGWVELAVVDDGPGLDDVAQGRLFQPFERLGAERGQVAGTGLGLALVRQLTEAMGGTVGVASRPGAGARFWVRLPAAR